MTLSNLVTAAAETAEDIAARISKRREKWEPRSGDDFAQSQGENVGRIVSKVDGSTEMVEIERPGGRFLSVTLADAALVHEVASAYDAHLSGSQSKSK